MCFSDNSGKVKRKCIVSAVISLIIHIIISCLSIVALSLKTNKEWTDSPYILNSRHITKANEYFGNMDEVTFHASFGTSLALGVLGTIASVLLMIGLKYNKPAYFVIYLCYSIQASILLLIGGLLLCLKLHWKVAIVMFKLMALLSGIFVIVNRTYEMMIQVAIEQTQNNISDLTRLIEEDLSDDMPLNTPIS